MQRRNQRTAKGASGEGPRQKNVQKKSVTNVSTLFDIWRAGQKSSKRVKLLFDTIRQFRAAPIFRPLWGGGGVLKKESSETT